MRRTPAATAMVGAQTTINNQLKAMAATVTETATMTATMMTIKMKAMAAKEAAWQKHSVSGGGSAAAAAAAQQCSSGNSSAAAAVQFKWTCPMYLLCW